MNLGKTIWPLFVALWLPIVSLCQNENTKKTKTRFKDKIEISGYLKYLNTTSILDANNFLNDNLIHNRINLNVFLHKNFEFRTGIRNRAFYGENIKLNSLFSNQIKQDNGTINMSWNIINTDAFLLNTTIDRLFINYFNNKIDIKLGRQRINWGISNLWNPNDLFNTYNFLDFDYEERPGTDALSLSFYPNGLSSIEFSYKPNKNINESIIALIYKFNRWNYDFQLLGGNYNSDLAFGLGWAGNIKNAGFKGEATYFFNRISNISNPSVFSGTIGLDYSFNNGVYTNFGFLYNSEGVSKYRPGISLLNLFSDEISAKNLMPTKYNFMAQVSKSFGPAWNFNLITVYGTGIRLWLIIPNISYSIKTNWDLDFTLQSFFAQQRIYKNLGNSVNLRLRYSY